MSIGRKHLIIPDTQVKPGISLDHFAWIGRYAAEKWPDVLIHLGDWYDLPSLCYYDEQERPGTYHKRSYQADLDAGDRSVDLLEEQLRTRKKRKPQRKVYLLGNHEKRYLRLIAEQPKLRDALRSPWAYAASKGWEIVPFLKTKRLDGVLYSHYFASPGTGKAFGGDARYKLAKIHSSYTCGHHPGLSQCIMALPDGRRMRGLVAGSCYRHKELYAGPQGNHEWSGILVKHQVRNGNYDLMEVSLDYLKSRYA